MPKTIEVYAGLKVTSSAVADANFVEFTGGMKINADGSPRAYAPHVDPPLAPLDRLANAGRPGNWWGIATDDHGTPYVQGPADPCPGYYVSTTALEYPKFEKRDPRRYVDSERVCYIVLPIDRYKKWGAKLGDFCHVRNMSTGKEVHAVFGDIGPVGKLGEGSIALAKALDVPDDAKTGGTEEQIIRYRFFPGMKGWNPAAVAQR